MVYQGTMAMDYGDGLDGYVYLSGPLRLGKRINLSSRLSAPKLSGNGTQWYSEWMFMDWCWHHACEKRMMLGIERKRKVRVQLPIVYSSEWS